MRSAPTFSLIIDHWLLAKKILLLVSICLLLLTTSSKAFAQDNTQTPQATQSTYNSSNTNPDVPDNLHTYTQSVFIELGVTAICQLVGVDITRSDGKCLGIDPTTGRIGLITAPKLGEGGLIGITAHLIGYTYTKPASITQYINYETSNFGLVKKTYAQGYGYTSLSPILAVWQPMRNMVYTLFVLAFVIVGLGIMFRIQIDPRTVMTIQNQIPKIIITLILITFSYAIAGLLIDFMWVLTYLIINFVSKVQQTPVDTSFLTQSNVFQFAQSVVAQDVDKGLFGITFNVASQIKDVIADNLILDSSTQFISGVASGVISAILAGLLCGWLGAIGRTICAGVGLAAGTTLGGAIPQQTFSFLGGVIAYIVIFVAIMYALFRLFIQLLKAYIYILLAIVISPFWIMMGIIPTSTTNFSGWLRHMVAHLSSFPAAIAMLLMARLFLGAGSTQNPHSMEAMRFVPPLIGNIAAVNIINSLIGVGFILLTPEIVDMLKEALKAPENKHLAAIGVATGVGQRSITQSIKTGYEGFVGSGGPAPRGPRAVIRSIFGV